MAERIHIGLQESTEISEDNVLVLVVDGIATLRGGVASPGEREAAEKATTAGRGGADVRNLIEVNHEGANSDLELSRHIRVALEDAESLAEAEILVAVNSGFVLLSGNVSAPEQRYTAERVVIRQYGVVAVRNEIQVAGL
jgi:osmotically-inducible protein OsmY